MAANHSCSFSCYFFSCYYFFPVPSNHVSSPATETVCLICWISVCLGDTSSRWFSTPASQEADSRFKATVEFACSPRACMGSLLALQLLYSFKCHHDFFHMFQLVPSAKICCLRRRSWGQGSVFLMPETPLTQWCFDLRH